MLTVTEEADTNDLISITDARVALGITGTAEDAVIEDFISRASDVIARFCNRVFGLETVSEQFRLDAMQPTLILSRYPIEEISSIIEGGDTLSPTDFEVDKAKGFVVRLHSDRTCSWSRNKTTVVYSAGYELPAAAPLALQQACIQLVKAYYIGADRDPLIRSESVTPMSSSSYFGGDGDQLPPEVRGLLKQFRKIK